MRQTPSVARGIAHYKIENFCKELKTSCRRVLAALTEEEITDLASFHIAREDDPLDGNRLGRLVVLALAPKALKEINFGHIKEDISKTKKIVARIKRENPKRD